MDNDIFIVREALESDLDKIYLFEREYIIEHEKDELLIWEKAKERMMKSLYDNLDKIFVATKDNVIVGHVFWSIYNSTPSIFSIYVDKNYRNLKIASNLINTAEKHILNNNYASVALSTLETNPAKYMFSNIGYEQVNIVNGWINFVKQLN